MDAADLPARVAAARRRAADTAGVNLLTTVENQPFAHTDQVRLRRAAGKPVSNTVRTRCVAA